MGVHYILSLSRWLVSHTPDSRAKPTKSVHIAYSSVRLTGVYFDLYLSFTLVHIMCVAFFSLDHPDYALWVPIFPTHNPLIF
jgi:hypothetical protein